MFKEYKTIEEVFADERVFTEAFWKRYRSNSAVRGKVLLGKLKQHFKQQFGLDEQEADLRAVEFFILTPLAKLTTEW